MICIPLELVVIIQNHDKFHLGLCIIRLCFLVAPFPVYEILFNVFYFFHIEMYAVQGLTNLLMLCL